MIGLQTGAWCEHLDRPVQPPMFVRQLSGNTADPPSPPDTIGAVEGRSPDVRFPPKADISQRFNELADLDHFLRPAAVAASSLMKHIASQKGRLRAAGRGVRFLGRTGGVVGGRRELWLLALFGSNTLVLGPGLSLGPLYALPTGRTVPSVVLLSHPSLTGINSGTGISGSTAWHNSVRSRMYMTAPKLEQGEQPDTDLRELQFKKSNYGPVSNNIALRYQRGLFLAESGLSTLDKLAREQKAEESFLALLARYEREGRNVSDKLNSPTYAPALFCKEREANGMRKEDLAGAMRRLFETGKIHVENYGHLRQFNTGPPNL
jgi:hypothetical protein